MYPILADISEQSALPSELLLNSIASVGNRVDAQLDGIHAMVALSVDVSGDVSGIEASDIAVFHRPTSTASWSNENVLQVHVHVGIIKHWTYLTCR